MASSFALRHVGHCRPLAIAQRMSYKACDVYATSDIISLFPSYQPRPLIISDPPSFFSFLVTPRQTTMLTLIIGGLAFITSSSAQVPFGLDPSSSRSCESLKNTCNAATVDFNNFYNSTACVLLTVCESAVFRPDETLNSVGAPKSQPHMTESVSSLIFFFLACSYVSFLEGFPCDDGRCICYDAAELY